MRYFEYVGLLLGAVGTACWAVCFWWMHRISRHQAEMLKELHAVTSRIEKLAEEEHELIREVHPAVEKIKEHVQDVAVAVAAEDASGNAIRR